MIFISEEPLEFIDRKGFNPAYGTLSLKRFLKRELETMIAGDILEGVMVSVKFDDGCLNFIVDQPTY